MSEISEISTYGMSPGLVSKRTGKPCTQCGRMHLSKTGIATCTAHLTSDKTIPCMLWPINGADVCSKHGGSTPALREKIAKKLAWEAAEGGVAALLRECDLPDQHPIDGLLEVVRHSGAMMRMLGYIVGGFDATNDDGSVRYGLDSLVGFDHNMDQASNIYVQMYGVWADRYARACKLALDANIDERLVRNAESTSEVFFQAVSKALDAAELDPEQRTRLATVLASELRKLSGPLGGLL